MNSRQDNNKGMERRTMKEWRQQGREGQQEEGDNKGEKENKRRKTTDC